jgi:hypothetical protein
LWCYGCDTRVQTQDMIISHSAKTRILGEKKPWNTLAFPNLSIPFCGWCQANNREAFSEIVVCGKVPSVSHLMHAEMQPMLLAAACPDP